jgi:hypothetical protein
MVWGGQVYGQGGPICYYFIATPVFFQQRIPYMTELMTTTIMLLTNACILVAGFAVTARMWLVCDNPHCAKEDNPIIAQLMKWLPIAVHLEGQVWGGLKWMKVLASYFCVFR